MVENDFSTPENERRFPPKKDHFSKDMVIFDMLGFRGVYMRSLGEVLFFLLKSQNLAEKQRHFWLKVDRFL